MIPSKPERLQKGDWNYHHKQKSYQKPKNLIEDSDEMKARIKSFENAQKASAEQYSQAGIGSFTLR